MAYLVLARKYRPQTFEEIVDQDHITQTLTNAIASKRVAHAILFTGPRGTGKTTAARILAKAMNCVEGPTPTPCNQCRSCREITGGNAADVFEIDGASNNSVDQVRELRENIKYMPQHSRHKIYIIDEVHMLSDAAFNALLKTLEEPPAHVLFFFATTEPHKIPITILSRCQRHDFRRIDVQAIIRHLTDLCGREALNVPAESLTLIAREAGGCMRDALSLLDQVMGSAQGEIVHAEVVDLLGAVDRQLIFDLSGAVIQRDIPGVIDILDRVHDRGLDLRKVYGDLIEHFRNLYMVKVAKQVDKLVDAPGHEIAAMGEQVKEMPETTLSQMLDVLFKEENALKFSSLPKLAFEMTCIKMMRIRPALPIETLIHKIDELRTEFYQQEPPDTGGSPMPEGGGPDPFPAGGPGGPMSAPGGGGGRPMGTAGPAPTAENRPREAPAGPSPQAVAGDSPGGPPAVDMGDKDRTWVALRRKIGQEIPSLAAPLANSRLTRLSNHEIGLQVSGNRFTVGLVERKKVPIEKVVQSFFGRPVRVDLDMDVVEEDTKHPGLLKEEALKHPLVSDALEIFNGKVVDVKLIRRNGS